MKRLSIVVLLALTLATPALAHFPWLLAEGKGVARIILSETLKLDDAVDGDLVSKVSLSLREADGRTRPLSTRKVGPDYVIDLDGATGTLHGQLDLGLMKNGESAHLLVYFPKAIVGDAFGRDSHTVGSPVELVVAGTAAAPRLRLLVGGEPQPGTEVTVVLPDDSQRKMRTDADGLTEVLPGPGRHGAWARHWIEESGERDGVAYKQVRRYATLVVDFPQVNAAKAGPSSGVERVGQLREASSSLGVVTNDGWVYVYGGHIAPTHDYSVGSVSGAFNRWSLSTGTWESLPGGPHVQGMNLAVHDGKVYRVGGMQPRNRAGEDSDNHSIADAARFDPSTRSWDALPPLSTPRSSHDLVVEGDKLIVLGGWTLRGKEAPVWADTIEVLDLAARPLAWKSVPQPFHRRALATAVREGSVYVLGGFDEHDKVVDAVDIYDLTRGVWSSGPVLPKGALNGFAPAACTHDGRVYVSLRDGGLYRLNDTSPRWERISNTTPRIAHRLVSGGPHRLLVVGGADRGDNLDLIEAVDLGALSGRH